MDQVSHSDDSALSLVPLTASSHLYSLHPWLSNWWREGGRRKDIALLSSVRDSEEQGRWTVGQGDHCGVEDSSWRGRQFSPGGSEPSHSQVFSQGPLCQGFVLYTGDVQCRKADPKVRRLGFQSQLPHSLLWLFPFSGLLLLTYKKELIVHTIVTSLLLL